MAVCHRSIHYIYIRDGDYYLDFFTSKFSLPRNADS